LLSALGGRAGGQDGYRGKTVENLADPGLEVAYGGPGLGAEVAIRFNGIETVPVE